MVNKRDSYIEKLKNETYPHHPFLYSHKWFIDWVKI